MMRGEMMDTTQQPPPPPNNNNNNVINTTTTNNNNHIKTENQSSPRNYGDSRLKRDEWSEGAVSSLLEAYEAKWVVRNRAKLKGQDWEEVARHVSARGGNSSTTKSPKTQTQCKNKIESMKKRYRSESAAAAGVSSWPLYSRLHHLLRGNNNSNSHVQPQPQPQLLAVAEAVVAQPLVSLQPPPTLPTTFMMPEQLPPPIVAQSPPPPAPPPSTVVSVGNVGQHSSDGYDGGAKEEAGMAAQEKLSDNVASEKNMPAVAAKDTDDDSISTPAATAAIKLRSPPANKNMKKRQRTIKRSSGGGRAESNNNNSNSNSGWEVAESIRLLAEVVARTEEARTEATREVERIRAEAEVKRGEMELKRTEIIANTHLQIAKIFAAACFNNSNNNTNNSNNNNNNNNNDIDNSKRIDPSLKIGRS